jgi:3-oxoacyl-[acyl-carrier-protein] synthase II
VAVVVESAAHAQARGAAALGELTGQAITSDAYRVAGNDPSGEAWEQSLRRAVAESPYDLSDVVAVYGDARGTAAVDIAEARAVSRIWQPGQTALANISGQVGHVHGTTPLLSLAAALETVRTGWAPGVEGMREPLPEIADHVRTGGLGRPGPCVVTAANWGGTYASVVLAPTAA